MQVKQPKFTELENITALIGQTENEADKIAQAMIRTGGIVADRLKEQAKEVEKRFQALMTRKMRLEEELTTRELTDQNIQNMLEFRKIVAEGLQNPTFDDKRVWLEILRIQVTVNNQVANITCRLPGNPVEVDLARPDNSNSGNGHGTFEFSITGSIDSAKSVPAPPPGQTHPVHAPASNNRAQLPNYPTASPQSQDANIPARSSGQG